MSRKTVNIAIIGSGVVGKAFINQLLAIQTKPAAINYSIIYVAKTKVALLSNDYKPLSLNDSWEQELMNSKVSTLSLVQLVDYLKKSPQPVILVDNTSNGDIAEFYPNFIEAGVSIATPNKKAFSSDLKLWKRIFPQMDDDSSDSARGLVYHEATVGAGLPIIGTLNDMINTGDEIEQIEGIFSGTLSYIFNEFSTIEQNDSRFSDVVKVAKELGYTEPDPRDDLNGLDVARKVTILARIAGADVQSPTSFPVQSLIPKPLESASTAPEFMSKLPDYDSDLKKLKTEAANEEKILRFVGKIDLVNNSLFVGVEKYQYSHPFASLKGADNVISIKTKRYAQPLIIQGAGAGAEVTAAGVLSDVLKISQRL